MGRCHEENSRADVGQVALQSELNQISNRDLPLQEILPNQETLLSVRAMRYRA